MFSVVPYSKPMATETFTITSADNKRVETINTDQGALAAAAQYMAGQQNGWTLVLGTGRVITDANGTRTLPDVHASICVGGTPVATFDRPLHTWRA